MIQDQYSDKSFRVLANKLQMFGPGARDLIKTAQIDYDEPETLADRAFAWPEMRKYAIHTKEHAAVSMIYSAGEEIPTHVRENLEKVASIYEIDLDATTEKVAEETDDPSDYMLPAQKFGRISDKGMVKEATDFFHSNYKKMDLETRTSAAHYLVKKAEAFDARISPTFLKHAGMTQSSPKILREWLEVRSNLAGEGSVGEGFSKMASFVGDPKNMQFGSRSDMIKIADTIFELDKKAELTGKYDKTLPDPLLTVFNTTKVASHVDTMRLGGKNIAKDDLLSVDPETYGDVLGADIISEISEGGQLKSAELFNILETLPSDMQMNLVKTLGI